MQQIANLQQQQQVHAICINSDFCTPKKFGFNPEEDCISIAPFDLTYNQFFLYPTIAAAATATATATTATNRSDSANCSRNGKTAKGAANGECRTRSIPIAGEC